MTSRRPRLRLLGRLLAWIAGGGIVLVLLLMVAATILLQGPRFGRAIEAALPAMRGRIHVGGGAWSWRVILALSRGRPAAFSFDDIAITDPEGTEVLRVRRLSGELELGRKPL